MALGNPAFSGMFLSLICFGFIGGISGVVLGTEQLNVLMHNTIYVPATSTARWSRERRSPSWGRPISHSADLPARDHPAGLAKLAAMAVRPGAAGISLFMMGAGLGVSAPPLGHGVLDASISFPALGGRLPDDGTQRHQRDPRGDRRHSVRHRGRHRPSCSDRSRPGTQADLPRCMRAASKLRRTTAAKGPAHRHCDPGRRHLPSPASWLLLRELEYLADLWLFPLKVGKMRRVPESRVLLKLRIGITIAASAPCGYGGDASGSPRGRAIALALAVVGASGRRRLQPLLRT